VRVQRNIHAGAFAGANFLADKEHRRFVALAFTDDNNARDIQRVQLSLCTLRSTIA